VAEANLAIARHFGTRSGLRRTWVRLGERGRRDPPAAEARAGRKSFSRRQLRNELKEPVGGLVGILTIFAIKSTPSRAIKPFDRCRSVAGLVKGDPRTRVELVSCPSQAGRPASRVCGLCILDLLRESVITLTKTLRNNLID
jgi:hypothetical protein